MPFRTDTGGFEPGDDDMADFMQDIVAPFLTDSFVSGGLAWIQQVPVEGAGAHPNFNYLFSRGVVGVEAPPYWFPATTAKTLFIFTGEGSVNTGQETYDQPGNPMNYPSNASQPYTDPTNIQGRGHLMLNTVVGPYDSYWLFGGASAEYLHVVLKVNSRQYRHFHVGMLTPLHPDLSPLSQYTTGHCIAYLDPDALPGQAFVTNADNKEHRPYNSVHRYPFMADNKDNLQFSGENMRSRGLMLFMPGIGALGYEWYLNLSIQGNGDSGSRKQQTSGNMSSPGVTTKTIGDVNSADDSVLFGVANCSGYSNGLGATLFGAEPTFTANSVPLVPIFVGATVDFESDRRMAPVAQVPDVFRVNMKSLDAEQEILVGSDTYIVFPMGNKDSQNTLSGEVYTGYEGLAYKKITADAA
jgi:hypothetical protein